MFVAAALMEYYCSKDKNIAFRIFELGLKKFSNCPEYVICYIDYLSHLNGNDCLKYEIFIAFSCSERQICNVCIFLVFFAEDNNTRVLFERILSSGGLEPAQSV